MRVCTKALLLGSAILASSMILSRTAGAAVAAPAVPLGFDMTDAQSDYVENCGGCHGIQGNSAPANIPVLQGRVGYFMCNPAARAYLLQLPNVALSRITDNAQLADLMNFVVFKLGGASVPAGTPPFTADEVARERRSPLSSASLTQIRVRLVEKLVKSCKAPASLKLHYPGQDTHPGS
jgi:hypothetical protein